MVVKIQDGVFWVVMPCSVVVAYQQFKGLTCLHIQEAAKASKILVSLCNITWCHNPEDLDLKSLPIALEEPHTTPTEILHTCPTKCKPYQSMLLCVIN